MFLPHAALTFTVLLSCTAGGEKLLIVLLYSAILCIALFSWICVWWGSGGGKCWLVSGGVSVAGKGAGDVAPVRSFKKAPPAPNQPHFWPSES